MAFEKAALRSGLISVSNTYSPLFPRNCFLSLLCSSFSKFSSFRNDQEKRDFVACGAAAGVAAAFGAPIGGVLFCLEEGASWWHPGLTFRTFFCAIVSSYTVNILLSGIDENGQLTGDFGRLNKDAVFSFGDFTSNAVRDTYNVWEVVLFIVIGAVGGFAGAGFNALNKRITMWRLRDNVRTGPSGISRFFRAICCCCCCRGRGGGGGGGGGGSGPQPDYARVPGSAAESKRSDSGGSMDGGGSTPTAAVAASERQHELMARRVERTKMGCCRKMFRDALPRKARYRRFREALVVCFVMSVLSFFLPYLLGIIPNGACQNISDVVNRSHTASGTRPIIFYCENGTYNQLGTLMFNTAEGSIKQLLHFEAFTPGPMKVEQYDQGDDFFVWVLLLFYTVHFLMACWTYGLPVPSGLFVPSLLAGAGLGRLFGEFGHRYLGDFVAADPGTYVAVYSVFASMV